MNLPVLVSERCGNHYEAVINGINGFVFNPYDSNSIQVAFNNILNAHENWNFMGLKSIDLYNKNFNKSIVIQRFSQELLKFSK
jgi:glycosyltransferase involved in cell wall biosynthesis